MWYDAGYKTWVFGVKESDQDTGEAYFGVVADQKATVGAWTHIAGTYDPAAQELRFYVNGKLQGARSVPGSWSSTGDFQIGRYQWAGQRLYHFDGSIDEVAAWQRVLTPAEIAEEARLLTSGGRAGVELVAAWDPSAGSGTTLTDTVSGYGRDLTLAGGATLDGEAILLDGTDGYASAPRPLVDGTGSFTATSYVEPDPSKFSAMPVGSTVQVLEQPTANGSSWGIWFEVTGKDIVLTDDGMEETVAVGVWHFGRPGAEVTADEKTTIDGIGARLTGVHDAQAGTVTLYVSDNAQGEPKAYTAKVGQGAFTVGRSTAGDYMAGRVLDLRVWAGAVANREQLSEIIGL